MMTGKRLGSVLLLLALLAGVCSCKEVSDIVVCGPTTYCFYGDVAVDAINQLSQQRSTMKSEKRDALKLLQSMQEVPAPVEGLFPTDARDVGEGPYHVELAMVYQGNSHFLAEYRYPRATLSFRDPDSGEQHELSCYVEYSFFRCILYHHSIMQTVEEYYESFYNVQDWRGSVTYEMVDGMLYAVSGNYVWLYFDLNPGIGCIKVEKKREDETVAIPYQALQPLCQWELIPIDPAMREDVTDHVGWW